MKYYLLIAAIVLASCKGQDKAKQPSKNKQETSLEAFIKKHPEWANNNVTNTQVNKEFTDSLVSWYKSGKILSDYVFQLKEINEYEKEKYAAKFVSTQSNPEANIEIVGIVNKSEVDKLINDKSYRISGSFIELLTNDLNKYFNTGLWNTTTGFDKLVSDKYYFGVALIKVDSVTIVD